MNSKIFWFTPTEARRVLDALERGASRIEISLDLNLSRESFTLDADTLIVDAEHRLGRAELQQVAHKENRIFTLEGGELKPLEIREGGYYKLTPTDQAPLLEISGVKMHISQGINPFESAGRMAAQVVKKGDRVLDCCSGLGYAATAARKLGAREVMSVELSSAVMELRTRNPWSQSLFAAGIELVQANIDTHIRTLATASFDAVIHDPPRFSLAGELYGEKFYREIYRVLKRRGALFHYTGNPRLLKRGSGFIDNAIKRLKAAGFTRVVKVSELMGVRAYK